MQSHMLALRAYLSRQASNPMKAESFLESVDVERFFGQHLAKSFAQVLQFFGLDLQITDEGIICVKTHSAHDVGRNDPPLRITATAMWGTKEAHANCRLVDCTNFWFLFVEMSFGSKQGLLLVQRHV